MSGGGFAIPRPVRVPGGIRAQSRTGDFARTWWGRRWLEVLRSLDPGVRLGRGKTYARQGQVVSLEVAPGRIHARVQGTRARPYEVEILLRPFGPEEGDRLGARLGEDPRGAARLLGGEMPPDLEGLCTSLGLSLFPRGPEDLGLSCTCPDPSVPCKHLAAVFLLLGEAFDEDPLLLLRFRGLDLEGLQESLLREAREEGHRVPEPLPEDPGAFWGVPSDAPLLPLRRGSEGPAPLPHRLGNLPFWRSIRPFLPSLETLSVALAAEARRRGEALLEAGPPSSSLPDEPEEPRGGAPYGGA